jgi:hypothetical protein
MKMKEKDGHPVEISQMLKKLHEAEVKSQGYLYPIQPKLIIRLPAFVNHLVLDGERPK